MPNLQEYSVAQLRKHISDHNKKYRVSNYWRVPKSKLIQIIQSGEHHLRTKLYRIKPALVKKKKMVKGKAVKGAKSKTHKGDLDFTTKKGDKDFHQKGHDVKKSKKPFMKKKAPARKYKRKGTIVKGKKHNGKQVFRAKNGAHYIIEDGGGARFVKK